MSLQVECVCCAGDWCGCTAVGIDWSSLGEVERELARKRQEHLVLKKLRQHIHRWQPFLYDSRNEVLLYLLSRSAADYAALVKILSEIKHRQPGFSPATLFDFGSGVGTTTW
ncbi:hypothetical protein PR048_000951 [Dryococelus australis]|uniref:Uncharacterized protein n=1 Tax=Dryococelus australis TaxID=614101 RepID=A0ABQ9IHG7_9NEOP|nr:hypothetical protein PR048_000951 [Dryococelus australis]